MSEQQKKCEGNKAALKKVGIKLYNILVWLLIRRTVGFRGLMNFFFYWRYNPLWVCILQPSSEALASSRTKFLHHTKRRATILWTSDQLVAETSTWHTTITTDKHPCPPLDSNPRSQQANGRRPMPQTARLLGSAVGPW